MPEEAQKILTAKDIIAVTDQKRELVEVPEWGGSVYITSLSAVARDAYEGSLVRVRGKEVEMVNDNTKAKLLALTLVDENCTRLFTDAQVEELGRKNGAVIGRLYKVALQLSGMNPDSVLVAAKN